MTKITSTNSGKIILKNRLCNNKVLVILDVMDELEQLDALCGSRNWFDSGSRILILIIYKCETTNRKFFCINPMCQNSKPLNVTSPLKNNFNFAILSIHTIQTIKYHYHTFSLFNSKFFKSFFPSYLFSYANKHHFQVSTHLSLSFISNFFPFFPHYSHFISSLLSLLLFRFSLSSLSHPSFSLINQKIRDKFLPLFTLVFHHFLIQHLSCMNWRTTNQLLSLSFKIRFTQCNQSPNPKSPTSHKSHFTM